MAIFGTVVGDVVIGVDVGLRVLRAPLGLRKATIQPVGNALDGSVGLCAKSSRKVACCAIGRKALDRSSHLGVGIKVGEGVNVDAGTGDGAELGTGVGVEVGKIAGLNVGLNARECN